MLDIQVAVLKTNKYATRESGDTVEVVERPHGGLSIVLADGQGSGQAAKSLSHMVTTKAITMIKDGARDGAVARSVHDYLYTYRGGKVSATLVIVSVDTVTRTLVISRNSHCPVLLWQGEEAGLRVIGDQANPIGIYAMTKPVITQVPLEPDMLLVTFSDGVMEAGRRTGQEIDVAGLVGARLASGPATARELAEFLLGKALECDANRPADDMTVLVLAISGTAPTSDTQIVPQVRSMDVRVSV